MNRKENCYATNEEMKKEAVIRMREMQLSPEAIYDFEVNEKYHISNNLHIQQLEKCRESTINCIKNRVDRLERCYKVIVYHISQSKIYGETGYNFLYVPRDKNEWSNDITLIKERSMFCAEVSVMGTTFELIKYIMHKGAMLRIE